MRLRMLVGLSGPAINLTPGDEHDFDTAEGARMIAAGFAVPVSEIKIERAVKAVPEARDVLDHDGDGKPGWSLKGEQSTVAKGRRKKGSE